MEDYAVGSRDGWRRGGSFAEAPPIGVLAFAGSAYSAAVFVTNCSFKMESIGWPAASKGSPQWNPDVCRQQNLSYAARRACDSVRLTMANAGRMVS